MLIAMVMVPIVAMMNLNGWGTFHDVAAMKPTNLNLFKGLSFIGIISIFMGIRLFRSTSYHCKVYVY